LLKKYQIYTALLVALLLGSAAGLTYVLNRFDPHANAPLALGSFYASSFLLVFSLMALLSFWVRRRFGTSELIALHFRQSLRQGILTAVLATCALVLQSLRLFSLVNLGLIIAALLFLEFYFISVERKNSI
jgi:hypothetical protein